MNVWKMNLIDNRDIIPKKAENEKFDFCKKNNIIGIGWVGYDDSDELCEDSSYIKAKKCFLSVSVGDLVWVKNPSTKNFYICKVKSSPEYKGNEYKDHDIGYCCKCEYYFVGTKEQLPSEILANDLICLTAISTATDELSLSSEKIYNNVFERKKPKLLVFGIMFLLVLLLIIVVAISTKNKSSVSEPMTSEQENTEEIVSNVTTAKKYFPNFSEFVERILLSSTTMRNEFCLRSDTKEEKAYARYDDPKMGYLSYNNFMMVLTDPYDANLKLVYNTVEGKRHLVITRDSPINDDSVYYLSLFLMDYPEKLYVNEMIDQFKENGTIINGEKVYKTTVGDVSYAFYEKQIVGTCRIIVDIK